MAKKTFKERVLGIVAAIPKAQTLSYKEVAIRAGRPLAWRVVGNIMKGNRDSRVPCHRVIKSSGELGGYNRGAWVKREILMKEGYKTK